jgi:thioredoxin
MEHLNLASFKSKVCECGLDGGEAKWEYKGKLPCIIDFYADWCGPCKAIAPILEQISNEYSGKLEVYKIDTEQEQELAGMFGIRSIPSLLFVPMNDKPQMVAGALPKKELEEVIANVLGVTK